MKIQIPTHFMGKPIKGAMQRALSREAEKQTTSSLEKIAEKETQITKDIAEICKGYEEFMSWRDRSTKIPTKITDKYKPTAQQILNFSKKLTDYVNLNDFVDDTSNYLTALMHSSSDKKFTIDLTELTNKNILLHFLGYKLQNKILEVNGNAGSWVGHFAENSNITINGNAGYSVGWVAENSKIYVKGKIESLSVNIGEGTEIYQFEGNKWDKIYPKK